MNNQLSPKVVLCRPRGGLNDTLCQIQRCFAYCRKHGRTLVLDTSRSGLRDDFFRYFDVVGTSVAVMSWHAFAKSNSVPGLTVHPAEVRERLDSYQTTLGDGGVYSDVETSVGLSFDFAKPHPARPRRRRADDPKARLPRQRADTIRSVMPRPVELQDQTGDLGCSYIQQGNHTALDRRAAHGAHGPLCLIEVSHSSVSPG